MGGAASARMTHWNDVHDRLAGRSDVIASGERWVELELRFQEGCEVWRQRAHVERVYAFGEVCLLIQADVAAEETISYREALTQNKQLAVGSIALDSGRFVIRHILPLALCTPAHLDRCLVLVAHEAARQRAERVLIAPVDATAGLFQSLAD